MGGFGHSRLMSVTRVLCRGIRPLYSFPLVPDVVPTLRAFISGGARLWMARLKSGVGSFTVSLMIEVDSRIDGWIDR